MKAIIRNSNFKKTILLMLAFFTLLSCSSDDDSSEPTHPEIILKVTDCKKDDITLDVKTKITGKTGRWFVNVTVTVTCMGEELKEFEVKVKYSFLSYSQKAKTKDGKATHKHRVTSSSKPSGKVTVTIEGSDGSKPMTVDIK